MKKSRWFFILLCLFCVSQVFAAAKCGDVNGDDLVDIVDAFLIAKAYVGQGTVEKAVADVDGDDSVSIVDALIIAQFYVGAVNSLSGCGDGTTATPDTFPGQIESSLIGWATMNGGTTGGGNENPIVVNSMGKLNDAAGGTDAKVIHVEGKLSGTLKVGSNKTIIGLKGAEISGSSGVVRLTNSKNVIIKNLKLTGAHKTVNTLLHNAKNVWLDHCEVVNGKSDVVRLTGTSDFVTISWNVFRQTKFGHEHMGVNIGLKDSATEGRGHMNVTLHHNFYKELINERMPRARFGKIHTFNNLCLAGKNNKTRSYYAVRAGFDANVRSERNVYIDFNGPSWWWSSEKLGAPTSTVFNYARSNENSILETIEDLLINCAKEPQTIKEHQGVRGKAGIYSTGTAFVPPYSYTADSTSGLEEKIRNGAGPQ